jgi:LacI family transcriptional regulator
LKPWNGIAIDFSLRLTAPDAARMALEARVTESKSRKAEGGAKPTGKPTLKTIAQMTGFAVTTISRALNNAPELAQETRDRVQKIAAEIGYLPDRAALRLKTGRTHVISLILDPHDELLGFGQSMVTGLTAVMRGTPYHLIITPNYRNVPPIEPIKHIVRNRMADGVIFSRTEPDDARVRFLIENDFPFVSHGRTEIETAHPYVDFDNFSFAYQAARRLIEKGRKRISIILPPARFTFGKHLIDGFMTAVNEGGVGHEFFSDVTLDSNPSEIATAVGRRLSRADAPDGYVASGDAAALAVMAGLIDGGRTIGVDVDVVAKQTSPVFRLVRPTVDIIFEDIELAGRKMGELLMRRIGGESAEGLQFLDQPSEGF